MLTVPDDNIHVDSRLHIRPRHSDWYVEYDAVHEYTRNSHRNVMVAPNHTLVLHKRDMSLP